MSTKWLGLLFLVLAHASLGAGVYKWVDEKGVVHYSETPPVDRPSHEMPVHSVAPSVSAATEKPVSKSWQDQEREFQSRRVERMEREQAARQQAKAELRVQREAREKCLTAQHDLHAAERQAPVYVIDEIGEKQYLDDKQRAIAVDWAKQQIRQYCPTR